MLNLKMNPDKPATSNRKYKNDVPRFCSLKKAQ
jgi:hypothetical protein